MLARIYFSLVSNFRFFFYHASSWKVEERGQGLFLSIHFIDALNIALISAGQTFGGGEGAAGIRFRIPFERQEAANFMVV